MIDLSDQLRNIKGIADLLWALASSEGIHEKDMAEVLAVSLYRTHDEIYDILKKTESSEKGYDKNPSYPLTETQSATDSILSM